jgi:hypothetical protein
MADCDNIDYTFFTIKPHSRRASAQQCLNRLKGER